MNGNERLVRLLIVPRRNHAVAILRTSFQKRGPTFSEFGVQMRCVRPDESSATITLHYCRDGAIFFRFSLRKQEFMIPIMLVLRALSTKSTDKVS